MERRFRVAILLCSCCSVVHAESDLWTPLKNQIEVAERSDKWNKSSLAALAEAFEQFRLRFNSGEEDSSREAVRGVGKPSISQYSELIGKYQIAGGDKIIEVKADRSSVAAFTVTVESRTLPATTWRGAVVAFTGDIVQSPIPSFGPKPNAMMELVAITKTKDGFVMGMPGSVKPPVPLNKQ